MSAGKKHQTVTKNSITRNYKMDWSCDQAIFILHELWVGDISEKDVFLIDD